MSEHSRRTYALCLRYFAELEALGVGHVVISPGSRSTPLTLSAAATGMRVTVQIDERVAAFHALGIGKATGIPAVLICTSGTALANHLPAVVEAHHAGVPLIVCSGDRPPELRRQGAGQTIDQPGIFGRSTRWFHEVAVASEIDERHGRSLARRSFEAAVGGRGPVHLNWPFRKPLDPIEPLEPPHATLIAAPRPESAPSRVLADLARSHERGLVVVGPTDQDDATLREIADFASDARWPLVADPASGLRRVVVGGTATVITTADVFLAAPEFGAGSPPEVVVRVGLSSTSAVLQRWLDANEPTRTVLVDQGTDWADPAAAVTDVVPGPLRGVFSTPRVRRADTDWLRWWASADDAAAEAIHVAVTADQGELAATAQVIDGLRGTDEGNLVVSSSMPIRVIDVVARSMDMAVRIWSNRGANGIDGVVATAAGVAEGTDRPTVALVGDVAALHDLGGIAGVARSRAPVVIVVLDNDGGGIFSMLPVRSTIDDAVFQRLFTTPHGTDLVAVAAALGLPAQSLEVRELADAVRSALRRRGPALLHVVVPGHGATPVALASLRSTIASGSAAQGSDR